MSYQLICTAISIFLNLVLILLIWRKSPPQTGKYRWLMTFTACFEIFWGAFDLPADINYYDEKYIQIPRSLIPLAALSSLSVSTPQTLSSLPSNPHMLFSYTAIFGASMAVFAAHFIYRFGSIEVSFGKRYTSGWKFSLLFLFPLFYSIWWAAVVRIFFWKNSDMNDYTRDVINKTVGQPMENISYIGTKFYNTDKNGAMTFNTPAWIGVCQMWFMVGTSVGCVFGFGTLCYFRLSNTLAIVSTPANNLQKQLFYALVLQTLIPLILMHFPITIFFLCPMLNLDTNFATAFILITITLYPAIDPLPSFFIIKSYREAMLEVVRAILCLNKPTSQVGLANSVISVNSGIQQLNTSIKRNS